MRKVLFVAAVLVALGVSARGAGAEPFGPEEEAAYAYAQEYWGDAPVLCSSVTKEVVPGTELGQAGGRATQPASPVPCSLRIADYLEAGPTLCFVMLHEYGHLLGYNHDDSEMAEAVLRAAPGCMVDESQFHRRQEWKGWRQLRAWCRTTRGQRRERCRVTVRKTRLRLAVRLAGG